MPPYAVVLIANRRDVSSKYWIKVYSEEELKKILNEYALDSYTEVIKY